MEKHRKIIYKSYRSLGFGKKNPDNLISYKAQAESYILEFRNMLPKDKNAKILDVGCGGGFLIQLLMELGYKDITGIDISPEQVDFAKNKGLPVICTDALDFLKKNKEKFEVIIATDLIEHLNKSEIMDLLGSIYGALTPKGYALIRTGNASSMYGITIRYIDFTHEIAFTENSLRQILLASGFIQINITDNKAPFGLKPRRLLRWVILKIWRAILKVLYAAEVGVDRPRLLGKLLIAQAYKE